MEAINGTITMTTCEGRPCWVDGRRAIFHRWSDSARPARDTSTLLTDENAQFQKWSVHGIVEYEDGTVEREWPNKIQFADTDRLFAAFNWDAMEAERDGRAWGALEITEETDFEVNPCCDTCIHENPVLWAEHCGVNGYDCPNCTAPGCICKTCNDSDKWEKKGARE